MNTAYVAVICLIGMFVISGCECASCLLANDTAVGKAPKGHCRNYKTESPRSAWSFNNTEQKND